MLHVLSIATVTRAYPNLEDISKYEKQSLSTCSHMKNASSGKKLIQSKGEKKLS